MVRYYGTGSNIPKEDSERIVAEALQQLSDDWIAIHHVSWQSRRNGRQGDGEADFILLHPQNGLLVLEVKGGGVDIINGRWVSKDRQGNVHEIKNPYEQATSSKHALIDWFKQIGLDDKIGIGHAVAFPHLNEAPFVGPSGNQSITFTRTDLKSFSKTIDKCTNHWKLKASLTAKEIKKIVNLLAPTVTIRRNLANESNDSEDNILKLTTEQIALFSGLKSSRGGLVLGGAGTGKTVLATARAYQLAQDGFNTLLLCFNELLGAELALRLDGQPNIIACTYHSLCMREIRKAGLFIPPTLDQNWWEVEAPNLLLEASVINETKFDAIVIDEGQDFAPGWIESLRCLTTSTKDAPFFIFADPRQELWSRDWMSNQTEFDFAWELKQNLRNSDPIADKVANLYQLKISKRNISGPTPIWYPVSNNKLMESETLAAIEKFIDEGFGPKNMVVLCYSHILVDRLRDRTVGPYSLSKWDTRGIPIETIARFKGMECEAVILVIGESVSDQDRMQAYVGMSRARSVLAVVGTNPIKSFVNWAS